MPLPVDHQPPLRWWNHTWRLAACGLFSLVGFVVTLSNQSVDATWPYPTSHQMALDVVVGLGCFILVCFRRRWPVSVALLTTLGTAVSTLAAGPGLLAFVSLATRRRWRESIPLREIPLTRNGTITFQIENVMASIGAAWGAGLPWQTIRRGLAGFLSDSDNAPARFNVMDYKGATIIADYGHNPDAIRALSQAVEAMPGKRRSVVISGAGDRRDQDIVEQTQILGKVFDDVILYQDACQRGREDGEVLGLLKKGLEGAPRTSYSTEIHGEFIAIDHALNRLQPGDLCLVLVDQVEEALEHLRKHVADAAKA